MEETIELTTTKRTEITRPTDKELTCLTQGDICEVSMACETIDGGVKIYQGHVVFMSFGEEERLNFIGRLKEDSALVRFRSSRIRAIDGLVKASSVLSPKLSNPEYWEDIRGSAAYAHNNETVRRLGL